MALLWNTMATRNIDLLQQALRRRFAIHPHTAWVNYVRCHDDIGWTFADADAASLGVNGSNHRQFLNTFYRGRFPGSFARGHDPQSLEGRVFGNLRAAINFRKARPELAGGELEVLESGSRAVLMAARASQGSRRLVLIANFSEQEQVVSAWSARQCNLSGKERLFGRGQMQDNGTLSLPPYDFSVFG